MGRVVVLSAPRQVTVVDEPDPLAGETDVLVETVYSGISAGTELTQYRGTNPHLWRRWDAERRLFAGDRAETAYPLSAWGYEEVGRVTSVGALADGVAPGDLVHGAWGHRSAAAVPGERAAACRLPAALPPLAGVFARIGAVALNAVLDAELNVGETVAIFGLGPAGLIAAQLAAVGGATVVAVDRLPRRLELARALGAAQVVDGSAASPSEVVRELTAGRGADVTIELSGSYEALQEAVRATGFGSRVVAAGFYQGEGAALRLGEEFHHNRVEVISSQIGAVAPRLAHRWNRERLEATVLRLAAEGRLALEPLVSHVVPVERAAEAFRLLDDTPEEAVQVVLDFRR